MIGDEIRATLPFLQQQAESMMTTSCVIRRGGTVEPDPVTGADVVVGGITVYDGGDGNPGCKVQSREGEARSAEVADATVTSQRWEIHVPVSSGPYQVGDVVDVTGRMFRVEALHIKSWQSAQRLPVVEVL